MKAASLESDSGSAPAVTLGLSVLICQMKKKGWPWEKVTPRTVKSGMCSGYLARIPYLFLRAAQALHWFARASVMKRHRLEV